jgi:hypothetical protein
MNLLLGTVWNEDGLGASLSAGTLSALSPLAWQRIPCGFLVFQVFIGGVVSGIGLGVVEWLAARGRERLAVIVALVGSFLPLAAGIYVFSFVRVTDPVVASLDVARAFVRVDGLVAVPLALGFAAAWVFALPAIARARGASLRRQVIVALAGAFVVAQALAPAAWECSVGDQAVFMVLFGMLLPAALLGPIFFARGRVVARRVLAWLGQDPPGPTPARDHVPGARVLLAVALSTIGFAWAIEVTPLPFRVEARLWGTYCSICRGPWSLNGEGLAWLAACLAAWLALEVRRGLERSVPRAEIRASAALVAVAAAVRPCVAFVDQLDWPYATEVCPIYAQTVPFALAGLAMILMASALAGRGVLSRAALVALGAVGGGLAVGEAVGRLMPLELVLAEPVDGFIGWRWPEPWFMFLGALGGGVLGGLLARLGRKGQLAALVLALGAFPAVLALRAHGLLAPSPYFWIEGEAPGTPLERARAFELGIGVAELPDEAQLWYERAAATGDREAIYRLAIRLDKGVWTPRDWPRAERLYEQALGCRDAEGRLAALRAREHDTAAVTSADPVASQDR